MASMSFDLPNVTRSKITTRFRASYPGTLAGTLK
jgi:hypothetical protein